MSNQLPHDLADLQLAPVVLAVDARIAHLAALDDLGLAREVDAVSERPTRDEAERRHALIDTIGRIVELHGWQLAWDEARGVRLSHGPHAVVLGVSASMRRYVAGVPASRAAVG